MAVQVRIFGSPLGAKRERRLTDQFIAQAQDQAEGADLGTLLAVGQQPMTVDQHKAYRAALQQRVADVSTINSGFEGFMAQQDRLRSAAITDEDRAQLDVLDTRAKFAHELMLSANPELQAMGIAATKQLMSDQQAFATTNEAQAIAGETQMGSQNWSRFTKLYDSLYRESSDYVAKRDAYGALQSAYSGKDEPGNAADIAAINSLQRMIDPGVSVREGDVSLLQNLAGVPDALVTAANRVVKGGSRFTPEERRQIVSLANQLMTAANEQQADRNVRFQGIAEAADLGDFSSRLLLPVTELTDGGALNFGTDPAAAAAAAAAARDPQTDSTPYMIGQSIKQGTKTAAGQASDFVRGLLNRDRPPPAPRPRSPYRGTIDRSTDEYPQ